MRDLGRLLRPRSVALLGGAWAVAVAEQLRKVGFGGDVWPVHPSRGTVGGYRAVRSLADLPAPPDAAFVGVNREASVQVVRELAAMGAGGAVCFASGFAEAEDGPGAALQAALVEAAGAMPVLGPNCYGFLNALDGVTLWPDQHGLVAVERGVAIVGQSSNVAINLTMQARALPIAYVLMAGNQAVVGLADLGRAALRDPRVSAVGLHVEGFGDLRAWEAFAREAHAMGKPVVVLKAGRSEAARAATLTHTASLAGGPQVASAFLRRTGCVEVRSLGAFLEALKLLHFGGPLRDDTVASVSCSGGEASLVADAAEGTALRFGAFPEGVRARLGAVLGPIVTVANPLDYHTFIWGDAARMTETFAAVLEAGAALTLFVLDLPRPDRCSRLGYECAVVAVLEAARRTGARAAVLATLPETMDEALAARFLAGGVVPLMGLADGVAAVDTAIRAGRVAPAEGAALVGRRGAREARTLDEAEAKAALARLGLVVPRSATGSVEDILDAGLRFPVALKALGVAHKTEAGAVVLGVADAEALRRAAARLGALGTGLLAEEMAEAGVEVLVGVARDPSGLLALTLGAGGVEAELLGDAATLVLPAGREAVREALMGLRVGARLRGFRGRAGADLDALLDAVEAVERFARLHEAGLVELDVNPLIAGTQGAVAVDALIRLEVADADA